MTQRTGAAMAIELNATHDPARRSWVESANAPGTDFPIQNLPFGVFDDGKGPRGGVALGDRIIDLSALNGAGLLDSEAAQAASGSSLLPLFAQPRAAVSALRATLSDIYRENGDSDDLTSETGQRRIPRGDQTPNECGRKAAARPRHLCLTHRPRRHPSADRRRRPRVRGPCA